MRRVVGLLLTIALALPGAVAAQPPPCVGHHPCPTPSPTPTPGPVAMSWTSVGLGPNGGFGQKTSGTTVVSNALAVAAGNVLIVATAWDNTDTTDVNPTRLSVTDTKGNTYTRIREFVNGQAAAAAGAHVGLFYSILTSALVAGVDTITATNDTAQVAKGICSWVFSFGAGSTITVDAASDLANDALDPGSMAISGLSSAERLYIRAVALERAAGGTWTVTTNFSDLTTGAGGAGTTGGGAATNMELDGEFRINTSTGETSDPTATAVDSASVFVALREVPAAAQVAYLNPMPQLLAQ